jgi:hypothetical protein
MEVRPSRELLEHALTSALPPLAVFVFEMFLKRVSSGGLLGALIVLYAVTFIVIFGIGKLAGVIRKYLPIRLPVVGRIDGWWIDVVHGLGGEALGGATIHIRSCGDGFIIRGTIYGLDDERTKLSEVGWFYGKGYATIDSNTVGYCFNGSVHNQLDVGSGHFTFTPPIPPAGDTSQVKGSFIGIKNIGIKHGKPGHHFIGTRVRGGSHQNEEAAQHLLLEHLQKEMKKVQPERPSKVS